MTTANTPVDPFNDDGLGLTNDQVTRQARFTMGAFSLITSGLALIAATLFAFVNTGRSLDTALLTIILFALWAVLGLLGLISSLLVLAGNKRNEQFPHALAYVSLTFAALSCAAVLFLTAFV